MYLSVYCRRQVNWREAKGEEEINIYQSERRRRTIHSLPKESRVSELTHPHKELFFLLSKFYFLSLLLSLLFFFCQQQCDLLSWNRSFCSLLFQVHPTSECVVDEGRRSQGNHGYHTRAAMEETSRQSAEAEDDDEGTSEVHVVLVKFIISFYGSDVGSDQILAI